jgi:hypothetical protein
VLLLRLQCSLTIQVNVPLSICCKCERSGFALGKWNRDGSRVEMIFLIVKSSVTLLEKKTVWMPFLVRLPLSFVTEQSERDGAFKGVHFDSIFYLSDVHLPVSSVGSGVVIAIVHENRDAQMDALGSSKHRISDVGRIRALAHPDSLFEECIAELKLPHRNSVFESEILDMHVPSRLGSTAVPAVRCQRIRGTSIVRELFDLGNKLGSTDQGI